MFWQNPVNEARSSLKSHRVSHRWNFNEEADKIFPCGDVCSPLGGNSAPLPHRPQQSISQRSFKRLNTCEGSEWLNTMWQNAWGRPYNEAVHCLLGRIISGLCCFSASTGLFFCFVCCAVCLQSSQPLPPTQNPQDFPSLVQNCNQVGTLGGGGVSACDVLRMATNCCAACQRVRSIGEGKVGN